MEKISYAIYISASLALLQIGIILYMSYVLMSWHFNRILMLKSISVSLFEICFAITPGMIFIPFVLGHLLWPLHIIWKLAFEKRIKPMPIFLKFALWTINKIQYRIWLISYKKNERIARDGIQLLELPLEIKLIIFDRWRRSQHTFEDLHMDDTQLKYSEVIDWERWMFIGSMISGSAINGTIPPDLVWRSRYFRKFWLAVFSRDCAIWSFAIIARLSVLTWLATKNY